MKGVVDIGSNAIRMLIGSVTEAGKIKKMMKHRVPIRLGHDVFTQNRISESNFDKTREAFLNFNKEFERFLVDDVRVVATSAVREATNQLDFVENIFSTTGLRVEIIDYKEEARLISQAVENQLKLNETPFLLMDIGGGSVEFVVGNGSSQKAISLPIGTVRLLEMTNQSKSSRLQLEALIEQYSRQMREFILDDNVPVNCFVGTGGNMECLGYLRRLLFRKESRFRVRFHELDYIVDELFRIPKDVRMKKFELREDRADVILPAALLSQFVLSQLDVDKILLPGVGLREGVLLSFAGRDIQSA